MDEDTQKALILLGKAITGIYDSNCHGLANQRPDAERELSQVWDHLKNAGEVIGYDFRPVEYPEAPS